MQKIGKWYEAKDAELFDRHHWSSCWLMGQLVHKEFKDNGDPSEKCEVEFVLQFWKLDEQKKTVTIISDHNLGDYMSRIYPSTTEIIKHMT